MEFSYAVGFRWLFVRFRRVHLDLNYLHPNLARFGNSEASR